MWGGSKGFYDIMSEAGLRSGKHLQAFIDASKEVYNKLENDGFPFAPMQPDFTFEQLEKEYSINSMATIVDLDSQGSLISKEPISLQTGKIPRAKKRAEFNEADLRKALIANSLSSFGRSDAEAIQARQMHAQVELGDVVKKLIDAHSNRITYNRHQIVSTGKYVLSEDNNKGGIEATVFEASIPDSNIVTKTTTARWWTNDTTEGSASNPIKDLKDLARAAKSKGGAYHFEVDYPTLVRTLEHSVVQKAIGYFYDPDSADDTTAVRKAEMMGEQGQINILEKIVGCRIVPIDSISRVDVFNQKIKRVEGVEVRSFAPDVWALVPDGTIGETLSVMPIRVGGTEANYAEYYGGRLLMTTAADVRLKIQYFETEMTTLVVPNQPKRMYLLKTVG